MGSCGTYIQDTVGLEFMMMTMMVYSNGLMAVIVVIDIGILGFIHRLVIACTSYIIHSGIQIYVPIHILVTLAVTKVCSLFNNTYIHVS